MAEAPDAGEVGRIVMRGDTLFSGYWPDGGGGPDADGWFVTGDIGYLDDAGELHLVDRAAEVVKVAGFTVYPREVEEVLATHPYVAEVAVIGVPGASGHEDVVAVLVAGAGHPPDAGRSGRVRGRAAAGVQAAGGIPPGLRASAHGGRPARPRRPCSAAAPGAGQQPPAARRRAGERGRGGPSRGVRDGRAGGGGKRRGGRRAGAGRQPGAGRDLDELGTRLPGTGDRSARGRQDTDEDLF